MEDVHSDYPLSGLIDCHGCSVQAEIASDWIPIIIEFALQITLDRVLISQRYEFHFAVIVSTQFTDLGIHDTSNVRRDQFGDVATGECNLLDHAGT
jgi:hypothetical protein